MHPSVESRPRVTLNGKYHILTNNKSGDHISLGSGTFGNVVRAREILPQTDKTSGSTLGDHVAIKCFKKNGDGISIDRCREISLLKELSHENIVKLIDIVIEVKPEKSIYLIFECAEYDLSHLIQKKPNWLTEPVVKSILWQLLNGVNYLHMNWVMHRDLKPANIIVMGDPNRGTIKIADFGLARSFKSPPRSLGENGVVVTIWYRAPEVLLGSKHYTRTIDIWAVGCIFGELLKRDAIFKGTEAKGNTLKVFQEDQLIKIFEVLGPLTSQEWPNVVATPEYPQLKNITTNNKYPPPSLKRHVLPTITPGAEDLLRQMLLYHPEERVSAQEALQHKYFTSEGEPPRPNPLAGTSWP